MNNINKKLIPSFHFMYDNMLIVSIKQNVTSSFAVMRLVLDIWLRYLTNNSQIFKFQKQLNFQVSNFFKSEMHVYYKF